MESNRNFAIYTVSFVLFTLAAISTSIYLASLSAAGQDWGILMPWAHPWIAVGEVALGLLTRGYCGFFLPGDSFRWSFAGPGK
jgi:hypothetical protein